VLFSMFKNQSTVDGLLQDDSQKDLRKPDQVSLISKFYCGIIQ